MKNIKRLVLGDMHGHFSTIKEIYDKESPDVVIMLGDYFDSFTVTSSTQKESFDNLLELKNLHELQYGENTFIMLLGNHDFHYLPMVYERYSGWNPRTQACTSVMVEEFDKKNIKICYIDEVNKILYTHAGVTNTWFKHSNLPSIYDLNDVNLSCLKHTYIGEDAKHIGMYGDTIYNGPLWVRPHSLCEDNFVDNNGYEWEQIVGHTNTKCVSFHKDNIISCDCLPKQYIVEYLNIEGKLVERCVCNHEENIST